MELGTDIGSMLYSARATRAFAPSSDKADGESRPRPSWSPLPINSRWGAGYLPYSAAAQLMTLQQHRSNMLAANRVLSAGAASRHAAATMLAQTMPVPFSPAPIPTNYPLRTSVPAPAASRPNPQGEALDRLSRQLAALQAEVAALRATPLQVAAPDLPQGSPQPPVDSVSQAFSARSSDLEPSFTHAEPSSEPASAFHSSQVDSSPAVGASPISPSAAGYLVHGPVARSILDIPKSELTALIADNPLAARYFPRKVDSFFYPRGVATIGGEGVAQDLRIMRDWAANVNVIPLSVALALNLPMLKTGMKLSSSTQEGAHVVGRLDTSGLCFILLPGTDHELRLPFGTTLVVDTSADMCDLLVGNEQCKMIADYPQQFPVPTISFYPNLVENPACVVQMAAETSFTQDVVALATLRHAAHVTFAYLPPGSSEPEDPVPPVSKLGGGTKGRKREGYPKSI